MGRAIRRSASKSYGYIILPIYLGDLENLEEEVLTTRFKDVWKVILALKSQDDSLSEVLDKLRFELGVRGQLENQSEGLSKITFDLPEKLNNRIGESMHTLLIKNTTETWEEMYGRVVSFYGDYGHCSFPQDSYLCRWGIYQRVLYKRKRLSREKASRLESIPGWEWDPHRQRWEDMFEKLKQYSLDYGHSRPAPATHEDLFSWVNYQRKSIKKLAIDPERYMRLKSLPGWADNPRETDWESRMKEIQDFCEHHGHSYPDSSNKGLRNWTHQRRLLFKNKKIEPKQIEELEKIPCWSWEIKSIWDEKYEELKNYAIKHGTANISRSVESLGPWVKKQGTDSMPVN